MFVGGFEISIGEWKLNQSSTEYKREIKLKKTVNEDFYEGKTEVKTEQFLKKEKG